jgi:hypothetical protein
VLAPERVSAIITSLTELRDVLASTRLPLVTTGAGDARAVRDALIGQIDDYLVPRLERLDAPLLAVIGGSTGSGKSTLLNSLLRATVSPAGVLRPTTRAPVLACRAQELRWFEDTRVLPGLARATGEAPAEEGALRLVVDDDVPLGLALLDAPDVDSIVADNRALATQLLAAADLWMWVTTASRYADAVPWEYLRTAKARSTALALVLNRVPPEAIEEVPRHLGEMLAAEGLPNVQVFVIAESALDNGLLPDRALESLSAWLGALASDASARDAVVRQTLEGALESIAGRVDAVAVAAQAQAEAYESLAAAVRRGYGRGRVTVEETLTGGALLRTEVLARWHELVGTGDLMRSLETRIGRLRDRLRESLLGLPSTATEVRTTLGGNVEEVVAAAADGAAERVAQDWAASPEGRELLAGNASLERASPGLRAQTATEVRAWQGHVLDLVRAEGAGKRAAGRAVSLGVNAVGAAVMVAVFAQTGGLTGAEVAIAGGTATVSHKLLEALFGDQAVRTLTGRARADLMGRVERLLADEARRFELLLETDAPDPGAPQRLRAAARALDGAVGGSGGRRARPPDPRERGT